MGRKRKPEHEKKTTIFVNIPNPLLWDLETLAEKEKITVNDYIIKILNEKLNK